MLYVKNDLDCTVFASVTRQRRHTRDDVFVVTLTLTRPTQGRFLSVTAIPKRKILPLEKIPRGALLTVEDRIGLQLSPVINARKIALYWVKELRRWSQEPQDYTYQTFPNTDSSLILQRLLN